LERELDNLWNGLATTRSGNQIKIRVFDPPEIDFGSNLVKIILKISEKLGFDEKL